MPLTMITYLNFAELLNRPGECFAARGVLQDVFDDQ